MPINHSGEFIWQKQDGVAAQCMHTVSHGCIDLSALDAEPISRPLSATIVSS